MTFSPSPRIGHRRITVDHDLNAEQISLAYRSADELRSRLAGHGFPVSQEEAVKMILRASAVDGLVRQAPELPCPSTQAVS